MGSDWAGLEHFERFFRAYNFRNILFNTLILSFEQLLIAFPMPILLALVLNDIRNRHYKKFVQTVTYAPFFLSTVVMVGLIDAFLYPNTGLINNIVMRLGGENVNYMALESAFPSHFYHITCVESDRMGIDYLYVGAYEHRPTTL